jgi:acetoin utilization deacetylase AcuC-like enzyme
MIIFHDQHCVEYSAPGHPERPARISRTVPVLKQRHPKWKWCEPRPATDPELIRAHSPEHLRRIKTPRGDFDLDTPAYPKIDNYARQSAGAAIEAACAAMKGERAFTLMRPPGHHATRTQAMGFCYFSNIAVAALDALENGAERVAIWDFDAHHGNGTEDIVANNSRIRFASIHQFPAYPGTGGKSFANIDNYPVAPRTPRQEHMDVCKRALDKLVAFKSDLILVSAGFDAYARDPLVQMTLEQGDFAAFGEWLREIDSPSHTASPARTSGVAGIPVAAILEGGYSEDLPELIDAFLTSWAD